MAASGGFWRRIGDILPTAIKAPEELPTYTAGLFACCVILVGLGFAVVLVAPFFRGSIGEGISTFVVALLSALMFLAIGAFFGLMFGIPRYSSLKEVDNAVAPNNNLEQISDWLTKMIVGISLVQFDEIAEKTKALALQVTAAMQGCGTDCGDNYAMGLAVIGFFFAAGFMMMYLWSRVYLLLDVGSVQNKIDRDAVAFKDFLKNPERIQGKQRHRERARKAAANGSAAMNLRPEDAIEPGPDEDDPWKGVFGGNSHDQERGRELTASVRSLEGKAEYCSIRLVVRSTDPQHKPLTGEVKFFLHDTFPQPIQTVQAKDNKAELEVAAWGAFTVGALIDGGKCKLELDLAQLADAPAEWRAR